MAKLFTLKYKNNCSWSLSIVKCLIWFIVQWLAYFQGFPNCGCAVYGNLLLSSAYRFVLFGKYVGFLSIFVCHIFLKLNVCKIFVSA